MENETFQIVCIKKDAEGNPLDKLWRSPVSRKQYNFQKRGSGTERTALLPFDDAAAALTAPTIFRPGQKCKNEELIAISERHVSILEKRESEKSVLTEQRTTENAEKVAAHMASTFVTKSEFNELKVAYEELLDEHNILVEQLIAANVLKKADGE